MIPLLSDLTHRKLEIMVEEECLSFDDQIEPAGRQVRIIYHGGWALRELGPHPPQKIQSHNQTSICNNYAAELGLHPPRKYGRTT